MCDPLVADWERIEGLAAMDADVLRCCSELEAQGYTEEVCWRGRRFAHNMKQCCILTWSFAHFCILMLILTAFSLIHMRVCMRAGADEVVAAPKRRPSSEIWGATAAGRGPAGRHAGALSAS